MKLKRYLRTLKSGLHLPVFLPLLSMTTWHVTDGSCCCVACVNDYDCLGGNANSNTKVIMTVPNGFAGNFRDSPGCENFEDCDVECDSIIPGMWSLTRGASTNAQCWCEGSFPSFHRPANGTRYGRRVWYPVCNSPPNYHGYAVGVYCNGNTCDYEGFVIAICGIPNIVVWIYTKYGVDSGQKIVTLDFSCVEYSYCDTNNGHPCTWDSYPDEVTIEWN